MRKPHNDRLKPTDNPNSRSSRAHSRGGQPGTRVSNPDLVEGLDANGEGVAKASAGKASRPSTALGTSGENKAKRGSPSIKHVPERKCVLTGAHDARGNLIRLALSPDGNVLPDVRAKAPGRGAWIGVNKAELETAIAKGRLKGALARGLKTSNFRIPETLAHDIAVQLERATLDRLGLEARASNLLTGAEKVDGACRSGQVALLLHSADASTDGRRKRDQSWRVGREEEGSGLEGTILPVDRGPLSMALGRENAVHVAITDRGAADRVRSFLDRWIYYLGQEPVPAGADAPAAGHDLSVQDEQAPAGAEVK